MKVKDEDTLQLLVYHCFGRPLDNAVEIIEELVNREIDCGEIFENLYNIVRFIAIGGKCDLGDQV